METEKYETMIVTLSESTQKARKEHNCMTREYIEDSINQGIFTFSEYRKIAKMIKSNWKIQIGEKYLRQNNLYDDGLFSFKASIPMHNLCCKYGLYTE